jgi:hypothetical protein
MATGVSKSAATQSLAALFAAENRGPDVAYVEVIRHKSDTWRANDRFVNRGIAEGWLAIEKGRIRLTTAPDQDDVVFAVVRRPGLYCAHCDCELADVKQAAEHVQTHAPAKSPDPNNPSGWRRATYFDCVREVGRG